MTSFGQFVVNGLMAGSLIMLPAIGFSLIYAVLRFPNFSVASIATVGGFAGYTTINLLGWPVPAAIVASFLAAGLMGVVTDLLFLKPLRREGIIVAAIGSLALNILIENVVRFGFGNDLRALDLPILRDVAVLGVRVGPQQLANIGWALAAAIALFLLLKFSLLGKQMRAVADNPDLATIHRIRSGMIGSITTFIAMGIAGIGGTLLALETAVDPLVGFRVLLPLFAASVVGGIGSLTGAVVGSGVIGIAEEFAAVFWSPAYRTAVGFIAIVLVLLIRPEGLFGRK